MVNCPHCHKALEVTQTEPQSDKDFYLEWWTPTLGAEDALKSWEEKQKNTRIYAPRVMSDITGYISQVDGSYIDSRSKHRDHLKRHRMIEVGNDVPMKQRDVELSDKTNKQRKEMIAHQVYEKLRYK